MEIFRKRKINKTGKTGTRIGVCSAARGSGATSLSLALANYLCSKRRKKTALAEVNGSNQIASLNDKKASELPFVFKDIRVYSNITFRHLAEISMHHFDFCVLDFGPLHANNFREFLQCDLGFIIGSILPWKQKEYGDLLQKFFHNKTNMPENIRCLATLGIKEDEKKFVKRYHFPVTTLPYLENPLQLSSSEWQFLQVLLRNMGI